MTNCVEIVRPFTEAIGKTDDLQLIGGVGAAALVNAETVIVTDEKTVIAPADLFLPQRRDDGNLRDFDALVLSSQPEHIRAYEAIGEEIIGDELELSFFGLRPAAELEWQKRHPLRALKQFLADRYVEQDESGKITEAYKALFPFSAPMPIETLETWRLYVGEDDPAPAPIPHPGTTVLNYLTRSISGLRPKDADKVGRMARNIQQKAPEIRDWIMDGPGQSQIQLARILNELGNKSRTIELGAATVYPMDTEVWMSPELVDMDAQLVTEAMVLTASYAKARALRFAESQEKIVTLWQRAAEKHVHGLVHNQ